jgi:dTMP kinase
VTILLDLDEAVARERLTSAEKVFDRLENEKSEFHERVRSGFLALAAAEPERFLVLNASVSLEELAASIRARIEPLLD